MSTSLEGIFERHSYGPAGVKQPDPNLHAVEGQPSLLDQLIVHGVFVDSTDALILRNPDVHGILGAATVVEYQRLLDEHQVAPANEPGIISGNWQQTA